ncbi:MULTISPECIES: hypothetical protein [unclassified Streptomyces]|uniref:hypothetical protein n=1 Tax=unclassified Streptomyces TaxID=2593676 RepID=UPI002E18AA22|nr:MULTISPECIES: hypothetical protein [unclassified Streptomyces]
MTSDAEYVARGIRLGGGDGKPDDIRRALLAATIRDTVGTWTIHTTVCGNLPGAYVSREAALVAVGYAWAGEEAGPLDELAASRPTGCTLAEIEELAAAGAQ